MLREKYSSPVPFVTFEGVEGSGKSTQLRLTAERLRGLGRDVVATREPGGTTIGRTLREILMDAENSRLDPVTEWLLLEAATGWDAQIWLALQAKWDLWHAMRARGNRPKVRRLRKTA